MTGHHSNHSSSRRRFLTASTTLLTTPFVSRRVHGDEKKLAIHGGRKSVTGSYSKRLRWGAAELEQLTVMLKQNSLFYWKGPRTELFKERFRKHHPATSVHTCSSGTAAVHIAVAAAGTQPGDEIITAPITDIGTVTGILFQQAVPVFADLEPHTYNLNVEDVKKKITPKTRAIIAVHLAGNPCDMAALKLLADEHDLVLIEDAAQAWGAWYDGIPVGTIGHFGCFSMMNSKHISTGDGGVVCSVDQTFGPLMQKYGDKGSDRTTRESAEVLASNYRMSEPQAAVGAAQLSRLEKIVVTRNRLGRLLTAGIADVPGLTPMLEREHDRCTYWFYYFRLDLTRFKCDRNQFAKALVAEGVGASAGYIRTPVYEYPMFQKHSFFNGSWPLRDMGLTKMDYRRVSCPESVEILKTGIRFRITEDMDETYVHQIAAAIRKVATHYAV